MQRYTLEQKYAVISILTQIMEADTMIHPNEVEYMNSIFGELNITMQDFELADSLDIASCLDIVRAMPPELKECTVDIFRTMISIDGNIDPREVAVINSL